jgi:hypothetical protein
MKMGEKQKKGIHELKLNKSLKIKRYYIINRMKPSFIRWSSLNENSNFFCSQTIKKENIE